jgi:Nucleotide modification associated domain 1
LQTNTSLEYDQVIQACKDLFIKKTKDYGTAWRILRLPSITDQIFIKAQRVRTLEEKKVSKVDEGIIPEYVGIINYCIIAMIQLDLNETEDLELEASRVSKLFDEKVKETKDLMMDKNHDYGEAWREMRLESLTDLILMKLMRVKQIEDNKGSTLVSEGVVANYQDMMNYSIFALIKLNYNQQ